MPEGRAALWRLGGLKIWLARTGTEWRFAGERGVPRDVSEVSYVPLDVVPEDLAWRSTVFAEAPRVFSLHPRVPDRPVLIPLPGRLALAPGGVAEFTAVIPVWIEVRAGRAEAAAVLGTAAAREPREAWAGTLESGRLLYAAPAAAVAAPEESAGRDAIAASFCLRNTGDAAVAVDQVCLDLRRASLYAGAHCLRVSSADVELDGESGRATVAFTTDAPGREAPPRKLAGPAMSGPAEVWPLSALRGNAAEFQLPEGGRFQ